MQDPRLEDATRRLQDGGKILISRLRYIGDVVLSLPLVQHLRRCFPHAEIHYLAEPEPLEILRGHPDVDRLWCAERKATAAWHLARALRRESFAVVVDLFANPRSALLLRATGADVRIGEARRVRRHLFTHARRLAPGKSAIEHHLDAAAYLGVEATAPERPRLLLSSTEIEAATASMRARSGGEPHVLVHLAATQPAKEWPLESAVLLIERLQARGIRIVLTTAPRRPEPSTDVARRVAGVRLLPVMPLRELLGFVATADAVLTVDGAITHCSVALGTPTLALFGPTVPSIWFPYERYGPFRVLHAGVDCGNCDRYLCPTKACMGAITVDMVERCLVQILAASPLTGEGSR